jgi:hypothetical protein
MEHREEGGLVELEEGVKSYITRHISSQPQFNA